MTGVSEQAIQAAKAVLAKCSANDPWFPQPSESTILAWAEQFMIANLPADDLLEAVTQVYAAHGAGFKPLPGDILASARGVRRDRRLRDEAAQQELTAAVGDRKSAEDLATIAAEFVGGKVKPTKRLRAAEAAMQNAADRESAVAAMREYFAAKLEAKAVS